MTAAVGPTRRLDSSIPGVLQAAGLAGWELLAQGANVVSGGAVGPTRRLDSSIPGVLEAAGLAGWDRLARMLTVV